MAFLLTAGVAAALGILRWLVAAPPRGAIVGAVAGSLLFLLFHHVGMELGLAVGPGAGVALSVGLALMLGTGLAGWLLFRAGRGASEGETGWTATASAAAAAVPFVTGAVALALVSRVAATASALPVPGGLGPGATFRPSIASALVWTLAIALICTLLGPLAATGGDRPRGRFVQAAARGGWRMTWVMLGLSFVGLLVVAGLHPGAVRGAVDRAFSGGAGPGAIAVAATALVTPNAATMAASASMGAGVRVEVLGSACTVLSYGRVPVDLPPGPGALGICRGRFTAPSPAFWLFLLAPTVATVAGGHRAARVAAASTRRDGVVAGIGAGLGFAVMFLGLLTLAGVSAEARGQAALLFGGDQVSLQVTALPGGWVAVLWGVGGGSLGGALGTRRAEDPGPPGSSDDLARS